MFTLILIIGLSLLFLWLLFNSLFMPILRKDFSTVKSGTEPLVTILVPLRNEEHNVQPLIESLRTLTYSKLEFIFLNDQSTDETQLLLERHTRGLPNARIIQGEKLPAHWVGKVFACHQLSKHAQGRYLFFLDADMHIQPSTIEALLHVAKKKNLGLISGFPQFPVKGTSWLCQLLVPMQHLIIYLHLPLYFANQTQMPLASAAHGSFMFFSKSCYDQIGGHEAIYRSLTEDIQLMRNSKQAGFATQLVNNTAFASCKMYDTTNEVWHGFAKNSFPGIGRSYLLSVLLMLFYAFVFVAPLFVALYGVVSLQLYYIIPYVLTVLMMAWVNFLSKQRLVLSFFIPFSSASLISILVYSMFLSKRTGYTWKGRVYK
ncbi:glycosyltransferase [Shouchella sp. 1P09AA]|uniref:glycosyltransferase n=1 Tax=unclassified Shouchella TaxID=2893065 RepID=UPI00399F4C75